MPPKACFICTFTVPHWERPYVILDGTRWCHFLCYQNARTKLVQDGGLVKFRETADVGSDIPGGGAA